MEDILIVNGIGWKGDHIAVFQGEQRIVLEKINPEDTISTIQKFKNQFSNHKCFETRAFSSFREFVTVSDFPKTLTEYYR